MLPHISQVPNCFDGKLIDFPEIYRSAEAQTDDPLPELDQFICGDGKEVAFRVKRVNSLSPCQGSLRRSKRKLIFVSFETRSA